jgi:hypothetical protein
MPAQGLRLPIDSSRVRLFTTGARAKAGKGGEKAVDKATGELLYEVHVTAVPLDSPEAQQWVIAVVGDPGELAIGEPVEVVDLVAAEWSFFDEEAKRMRQGISLKAASVRALSRPGSRPSVSAGQPTPANGLKEPVKP